VLNVSDAELETLRSRYLEQSRQGKKPEILGIIQRLYERAVEVKTHVQ
jgi:hypothetical protein